jgi:hypothetical protein
MVGLQFDMSIDDLVRETLGEDPKVKALRLELRSKYPKGDCITTDVSIKKAQALLPDFYMEKAGGNYKVEKITGTTYQDTLKRQKALEDRKFYVNTMVNILPQHVADLEAEFKQKDCRGMFEKERLQDMATVVTKQATLQEQSVLGKNYKEQYLYIGIGAGILLLGLYVISKK